MTVVKHAIFVEPEGSVRDLVIEWKARVAARWPAAAYVDHPPHATIWIGEMADAEAAVRALAQTVAQRRLPPIAMRSPVVFADDPLAAGGQTCAFGAVLDAGLSELQRALADAVVLSRAPAGDETLSAALRREPFLASWRAYGFPFVGTHWIPHFTVASLPVAPGDPSVAEFNATALPPRVDAYRLGWWRVEGDRHERLEWLT